MTDAEPLPEDRAPLPLATPAASPRDLALTSWLHGGPRVRTEGMRVLEIGCRDGENLLPLAFYDPGGTYLGLDTDPAAIAAARAGAAELGLANARFEAIDAADLEGLAGPFDCVLVRDFFARVPEAARAEVLRQSEAALADEGILYLDYPVAPGASVESFVRAMVRPLAGEGTLAARVERVKAGAASLRGLIGASAHPYPKLLALALDQVAQAAPAEVQRAYLDGDRAVFLHAEVTALAASHGLSFLCDAAWNRAQGYVPDDLRAELGGRGLTGDALEQAIDVLVFRSARASVLCRASFPVAEPPTPAILDELHIASPLVPARGEQRLDPGVEQVFLGPVGERISSVDPLFKAALLVLQGAYPRALGFAELVGRAVQRLQQEGADGEPSDPQLAGLASDLWALHRRALVELRATAHERLGKPGGTLHALARLEARSRPSLTTPMHGVHTLSGFDAQLVKQMDPALDRDGLVGAMVVSVASGEVALSLGGSRLTDPLILEPMVRALIDRSLVTLARWGLLDPG